MKFVLLEWIGTETRFFSILSSAARPREVGQFSRSKVGHFSTLADRLDVSRSLVQIVRADVLTILRPNPNGCFDRNRAFLLFFIGLNRYIGFLPGLINVL